MFREFSTLDPVLLAFIATFANWLWTAAGAALVFFFKEINRKVLDGMLGFAAGIMIASSFWSLLGPAIEMARSMGLVPWVPAALGFLGGGLFLKLVDKVMPHLHMGLSPDKAEGPRTSLSRSILLVLAITLHNIPEGLAVGVGFGAISAGLKSVSFAGAAALALGIGLQNFPEGAAVSLAVRREGFSRTRSFMYGQMSGVVEPIAGVIGALMVTAMKPILPYAMAFAAGAMIYVVVEEVLPESQTSGNSDISTLGALAGFAVMMVLDVALT